MLVVSSSKGAGKDIEGQMATWLGPLLFGVVLIALPSAAWCRSDALAGLWGSRSVLETSTDRDMSQPRRWSINEFVPTIAHREVTVRFQLSGTMLCLSWGPDSGLHRPGLEECNDGIEQEWTISGKTTRIEGPECLTLCTDEEPICNKFEDPKKTDVILTECTERTLKSQLWYLDKAGDQVEYTKVVSWGAVNCLTADEGILTEQCTNESNQFWITKIVTTV